MNKQHYEVVGLKNETMKTALKNSLEKIHGVDKVCVDLGRSTVEVMYNDPANCKEIEDCIKDIGYNIK